MRGRKEVGLKGEKRRERQRVLQSGCWVSPARRPCPPELVRLLPGPLTKIALAQVPAPIPAFAAHSLALLGVLPNPLGNAPVASLYI